jgi:hypothetical protein
MTAYRGWTHSDMAMRTFLDLGLELRRGLGMGLDPLDSAASSVSSAGVSSVVVVVILMLEQTNTPDNI